MDGSKTMTLSYASVVKIALCKTAAKSKVESSSNTKEYSPSKSWFEHTEDDANVMMSRSNSLLTILSDELITNCTQSNVDCFSTSHSMDSGQVSDMSSDNETSTKSSHNDHTDHEHSLRMQNYQRRASVDSCQTSSSTCCSNPSCSSNHDSLKLMCQRWQAIKKTDKPTESDEGVLARRQKQIDYGKSTIGYGFYREQVPVEERTKDHPQTPNKYEKYSRRAFDGLIKIWRKQLHKYDPASGDCLDDQYPSDDNETTDMC